MASSGNLTELLSSFDGLLAAPGAESKSLYSAKSLVLNALKLLEMTPAQLSTALDVSPASVSRWANGQSIPHTRHLRSMQELVRLKVEQLSQPDGLEFHGRKVGFFGLDTFFRRARDAKKVYVLKNFLGFQAGVSPAVKHQLSALFAANNGLKICYGFPRDSEAAMSFLNFRKEIGSDWPMNIYWKEMEQDDELMRLLGSVFASPFIIEYPDGGIDVLLEIPVKVLRGLDEYDLSGYMSFLTEISDTHKHRMWAQWKAALEKVEWDSTPVKIRLVKNSTEAIIEVRDRAYDFLSSGQDAFDIHSFYIVAEVEGKIVGSIRLTDSEKSSPLQHWAKGKFPLPHGDGVVELTRGVVDPNKRNLGIYKWMMLRAMREALAAGFRKATAAVEEGYYLMEYLRRLGFGDIGKPIPYDDEPRQGTLSQSIVCDLVKSQHQWNEVEMELEERRKKKGIAIVNG